MENEQEVERGSVIADEFQLILGIIFDHLDPKIQSSFFILCVVSLLAIDKLADLLNVEIVMALMIMSHLHLEPAHLFLHPLLLSLLIVVIIVFIFFILN